MGSKANRASLSNSLKLGNEAEIGPPQSFQWVVFLLFSEGKRKENSSFSALHFQFFSFLLGRQGGGYEVWISSTDVDLQGYCRLCCLCPEMRSLSWLDLIPFPIWMHIPHQSEARRANKLVCREGFDQSGFWLYSRTYLVLGITKARLYGTKDKEECFCNWQEVEPVDSSKQSACLFQSLYTLIL